MERLITEIGVMYGILTGLCVFVLWIFTQIFATKTELRKTVKELQLRHEAINNELHSQDKSTSNLNIKIDSITRSVNDLSNTAKSIHEFLLDNKKR